MTPADLLAIAERPAPPVLPGQLAVPDGPAIGSVCTGYGGLDAAVQQVIGGHLAWVADPDPGATAILTHHHPDVPNLGDITALDWATVPPVDVLGGGYPCQPFSVAGLRKGTADARHIWPYIATAIRVLRPRLCLFENVAGHVRLGLDAVLADLAALGFDAEWTTVRASDIGAAHQRERLFLAAWPADSGRPGLAWWRPARPVADSRHDAADAAHLGHEWLGHARGRRPGSAHGRSPAADPAGPRRGARDAGPDVQPLEPRANNGRSAPDAPGESGRLGDRDGGVAPDADRDGCEGQQRRELGMGTRGDVDRRGEERWGHYAPAIARWEAATGRAAPWATDPRGRLSPAFVEWLMGLPAGHVTAVPGLSRTRQLKALGNGVVPAQAAAALRLLLDRITT